MADRIEFKYVRQSEVAELRSDWKERCNMVDGSGLKAAKDDRTESTHG